MERTDIVTMHGNPLTLMGAPVAVGDPAPEFNVLDNGLAPASLDDCKGKVCILASVPSLDTSVCSLETKRFNDRVKELGSGAMMRIISMDLPFGQKRWTDENQVSNLGTWSDHKDASFGMQYGVLIKELRLLARAVFVIDKAGKVAYVQIVSEVSDEPDYDAVIAAAKALL